MHQSPSVPWWRLLNRYQWFVLSVAVLGWLFDCLDQQIFNLARVPAMRALAPHGADIQILGSNATSIFLIGWALGGLTFGVLGDRIGRAKTMVLTILIYSLCTGLSGLAKGFADFAAYRFITGVGVGGEFAVGVALVAETMPDAARPYALGMLQALSAVGNVAAAIISMLLGNLEANHVLVDSWRWMFAVGAIPALLVVVIQLQLKEPERWVKAKAEGLIHSNPLRSYASIWGSPRWRKNAILGMLLACAGIIGLWGIGFFSLDLIGSVLKKTFEAQQLDRATVSGKVTFWKGVASMALNFGGFFGMLAFSRLTAHLGRRKTFALAFSAAFVSTVIVFLKVQSFTDIFLLLPIMGFCQFAIFGGYAIYLPELFPTSLRSTGVSLCYNVGRFVAALGPALLGNLTLIYKDQQEPLRYAGVTMCLTFLAGLAVLPFAPETKGEPLPDDERALVH